MDIDRMAPATGRMIKEDDSIVNLADLISGFDLKFGVEKYKTQSRIIPLFEVGIIPTTNQPANDSISIVSDSASDTQIITIWGLDNANVIQTRQLTLTGVTPVVSTLATNNWKTLYGAFLGTSAGIPSARAAGTITFSEASGGLAITTIVATKLAGGMQKFTLTAKDATLHILSGNVWVDLLGSTALSSLTGYRCSPGTAIDFNTPTDVTFVSDITTGTAQVVVWEV